MISSSSSNHHVVTYVGSPEREVLRVETLEAWDRDMGRAPPEEHRRQGIVYRLFIGFSDELDVYRFILAHGLRVGSRFDPVRKEDYERNA